MCRELTHLALLVLVVGLATGTARAKLVAYYPLNEGTGTTTADASGNGHDGTLQGIPTWVDGPPGFSKALSYNGQNPAAGWVNCGTWNPSAATGQLTVTFWAKWAGPVGPDNWQGVVGKRDGWDSTGAGQMWEFEISATSNTISFFRGDSYPNCGGRILPVGEWAHVAATFDGTTLIFYIDGQETGRGGFSFGPTTDAVITIGCDNSGGSNSFNGALDEVRIYDTPLPPTEIKKLAARFGATKPSPADGAINGANWANLSWTSGSTAVFHEIYFGTSYDDVFNGTGDTLRAKQPLALAFYLVGMPGFAYPTGLPLGQTYYWRIDEVDLSGTKYKGPVWSFLVPSKKAYKPSPADAAQFVDPNADLTWSGGLNAIVHYVFFGESFEDVNQAAQGTPTAETSYDPGTLAFDRTYYWRVDEFDARETYRGDVWSFRITPPGLGTITQEIYENVTGDLAALKAGANFPDNPTSIAQLTSFDTPGWGDAKDNYGGRMHGWAYVPVAGEYTFWVASDDTAELWLSQDDDPSNAQLIASVPGWTGAREWEKYPEQKSVPIKLDATRYYIMALWQDGVSGDHCEVAWQGPGIANREIISGTYLKPYEAVSAYGPRPSNKTTGVPQDSMLSWKAGTKAAVHDVYFGDDEQAVTDANTATAGIYKGQQPLSETTFDPGALAWGKTYYWRIDEVNDAVAGSPWKGGVWSFTAADFIVVDDFESYTDEVGERIFQSWIDGYGYTDPVVVQGNGTGSTVGNVQPPFAEQTIVHSGRQAMPMDYNNAEPPFYSEAGTTWANPQNWTVNGVTNLTLFFRGNAPAFLENADGSISMAASGTDIWETADQFRFAYKRLSSDGSIVARVDSLANTNGWAKAGVMIRESLAPGSTHAAVVITPSNGVSFPWREFTDNSSTQVNQTGIAAPYWVKLTRTGKTFKAQHSADGKTWMTVGTDAAQSQHDITMTGTVYIGLCLTSHNASATTTATFSNITTTSTTGAWQVAGIGTTHPGNSQDDLYVVVEDSAGKSGVATNPDPAAVLTTQWTEWKIPLSQFTSAGVSMTKVKKMYIGVGDRKAPQADGSGRVYIDDIRVTNP
jgi:regulation of enolase protein 1 (concanavalin A-like superfamily)